MSNFKGSTSQEANVLKIKGSTSQEANVLNEKGGKLMISGLYEEAIPYFDKVIMIDPQNFAAWHNKAMCFAMLNRMEEAEPCFKKAFEIDPKLALEALEKLEKANE
jgi:tetratricopeptide (TPR) repeat protein